MYHEHCVGRGYRHGRFAGKRGFLAGFAGGFMGGARGARPGRLLASGDLELIILALLDAKPRHGYEIIKALEEHSSGVYAPSPGMVYPALTYLEEAGYASSELEGTKKLYRMTDAGRAYLAEHRRQVDETLEQLASYGRKMAQFQRRFSEAGESPEGFDADDMAEWRQLRRELRGLRHELRAALEEKRHASAEEKSRIIGVLRDAIAAIRGRPGTADL